MNNNWSIDVTPDGVDLHTSGLYGLCMDDIEELTAALKEAGERYERNAYRFPSRQIGGPR